MVIPDVAEAEVAAAAEAVGGIDPHPWRRLFQGTQTPARDPQREGHRGERLGSRADDLLLLKKVEELTLHAIQQQKALEDQAKSNEELRRELEELHVKIGR